MRKLIIISTLAAASVLTTTQYAAAGCDPVCLSTHQAQLRSRLQGVSDPQQIRLIQQNAAVFAAAACCPRR
jgi:hypothetical protein